jgi:hypothetical protein
MVFKLIKKGAKAGPFKEDFGPRGNEIEGLDKAADLPEYIPFPADCTAALKLSREFGISLQHASVVCFLAGIGGRHG